MEIIEVMVYFIANFTSDESLEVVKHCRDKRGPARALEIALFLEKERPRPCRHHRLEVEHQPLDGSGN